MSSQSDRQKLEENDFLVERFIGKLLDSGKINQGEIDDFRSVFQNAIGSEFEKTPKERLFVLAQIYAAERERLNREIILAQPEIPKVRSEDVLLQEIVDEEILRCRDIPPEMYEQAQVAVRSDIEYIVGTKVNDQVVRRLVQSAIIDFCRKEKLIVEPLKEFVVPEIPKSIFEDKDIFTQNTGVFRRPVVIQEQKIERTETSVNDSGFKADEAGPSEEDSIRKEILNQIKYEKPVLAADSDMRQPHFFEASQSPEIQSEINQKLPEQVQTSLQEPIPGKPKLSVLQKIFKPASSVERQAIIPIQQEKLISITPEIAEQSHIVPIPSVVVPRKQVLQYPPKETDVQTQQMPQQSFKSNAQTSNVEDAVLKEEPIFRTRVTSFAKGGSAKDDSRRFAMGEKRSLTDAFLAEARLADQNRPLHSNAAKNGVALESIIRQQSRHIEKPLLSIPEPVSTNIPVPRKMQGERIVEMKNTGNPEKDLAAASNTRVVFDKSVELDGGLIEERHAVRSQEKSFFDKFIFEQISLISGMIKSTHSMDTEQLQKIQENLSRQAETISGEDSQSISSRIARLDALFQGEKKKYAVDNPLISSKPKADPVEDLVNPILARLGRDIQTSQSKEDIQFKDTLRHALIFKGKQMRDAGFDDKAIHKALEESYVKHINFYLRGVG